MGSVELEEVELGNVDAKGAAVAAPATEDDDPVGRRMERLTTIGGSSEPDGDASILSSIFNLTNTVLGSGILGFAYVTSTAGIGETVLLLLIMGFLADRSIFMLISGGEIAKLPEMSYPGLGEAAYGVKGKNLVIWSVIIQQLGACIIYIQIIADVISPEEMFSGSSSPVIKSRQFWMCMVVIFVIFPLCQIKKIDSLRYSSLMALALMFGFVFLVMGVGAEISHERGGASKIRSFEGGTAIFQVLPTISFAFVCHMNVPPIYRDLSRRSIRRMGIVSKATMCISGFVYVFVGSFGYLTFLDCTKSDLLKNFLFRGTPISTAMDVLRIGIGFALIFSYPLIIWELRHCVDEVVYGHKPYNFMRYLGLNTCIIGFCLIIALFVDKVNYVFDIAGSSSSALILMVMPSLFYMKVRQDKEGIMMWSKDNWSSISILTLGVVLIPICVTVTILGFVNAPKHPDTCDMCIKAEGNSIEYCTFP